MFDDLIKKKKKGIQVKATKRKLRARWTHELNEELKTIYSIKKEKKNV